MSYLRKMKDKYNRVLKTNVPDTVDVKIEIEKKTDGFVSRIKLVKEKGKTLWAKKSASTIQEAIKKSSMAMINQARKSRPPKRRRDKMKLAKLLREHDIGLVS